MSRSAVVGIPMFVLASLIACGGSTEPGAGDPESPVPHLTAISPEGATAGGPAFALTVTGTGFTSGTRVRWAGSERPTTYKGTTSLIADIAAADLSVPGAKSVTVITPGPGGGTSNERTFVVEAAENVPTLVTLSPSEATAGDDGLTLTATGKHFIATTILLWDGTALVTHTGDSVSLMADIPAAYLASAGEHQITAFTSGEEGGESNAVQFIVKNPVPQVTSLNRNDAVVGSPGFELEVAGSGFVQGTVVMWNGVALNTSIVNAGMLTVALSDTLLMPPRVADVAVRSPAPGGGSSVAVPFTISEASVLSSLSIPLRSNALVWDAGRQRLLVAVGKTDASHPNSIVPVDPLTGSMGSPIAVAADPGALAISADGSVLYVGSNDDETVQRVDLQTNAVDLTIPLGTDLAGDPTGGQRYAQELAVVPGAPHSVVVVRRFRAGLSPNYAGAVVFDDDIARPDTIGAGFEINTLTFGSSPSELFGFQNASSDFNLYSLALTANGLAVTRTIPGAVSSYMSTLAYVQGRLFFSEGVVYDPVGARVMKSFGVSGPQAIDASHNRAFYQTSDGQIAGYELSGFRSLGALALALPAEGQLTRWGSNGFAYTTDDAIVIVRTNLVEP